MGLKKYVTTILMIVLVLALAANAFAGLPEVAPSCSISAPSSVGTTATVTAQGIDILANAGMDRIKIYDGSTAVLTQNCGGSPVCSATHVSYHYTSGTHTFRAQCKDIDSNYVMSDPVTVTFAGENNAPQIDSVTPLGTQTIDEDESIHFTVSAHDPDGDTLTYSWKVDGYEFEDDDDYTFQRSTSGEPETVVVSVEVSDPLGYTDMHTWYVNVNDLEPDVTINGETGLDECQTFDFSLDKTQQWDPILNSASNWDFDDGTTGTGNPITHLFSEDGTYEVSVTVQELDGDTNEDPITFNTEVLDIAPTAIATADDVVVPEGTPIQFYGDATIVCNADGDLGDMTYSWDFAGLGTSTEQNPTFTFTASGMYDVTLTVTDDDGSSDDMIITIIVEDSNPEAACEAFPAIINEGETVQFNDTSVTYDTIDTWNWDFGDGVGTSTEQNPTYSGYTTDDASTTYTAELTVEETDGDIDTATCDVEVLNNAPDVDLTITNIASPYEGDEPLYVEFECVVAAGTGNADYEYEITFGDGTTATSGATSDNSFTATHTYTTDSDFEDFTAECVVVDADGDEGSDTEDLTVFNNVPEVTLVANITEGDEALNVNFDCIVAAGTGDAPFNYTIVFGDGTASEDILDSMNEQESAEWEYLQNGTYTAYCVVEDEDGDVGTSNNVTITVNDTEPVIDFTWAPDPAAEMEDINFTAILDVYDGWATIEWDYDDGTTDVDLEETTHNYMTGDDYEVCLTVIDNDDSTVTVCHNVTVLTNPPEVELMVDPDTGYEPLDVTAYCDIFDGDGPDFDWEIDFGDGTAPVSGTATGVDPSVSADHTYIQNGTYTVTCVVTDSDADTVMENTTVIVLDTNPEANFTWTPTIPDEGEDIQFEDLSTAYDDPIAEWSWDFDDDGVEDSNEQDPVWNYASAGFYNVTLTVTDSDGSTDTITLTVEVGDSIPNVLLVATPEEGQEPLNVSFTCDTFDGNADFTYELNFDYMGDTETATTSDMSYSTWYEFTHDGLYNVSCTVTDADMDSGSDWVLVNVTANAPEAQLTLNETEDYEPLTIEADCTSIADAGNAPFNYTLDFGDGTILYETNYAVHTYDQNGTYTVNCTIEDADGDISSEAHDVNVLDTVPEVSFAYYPSTDIEEGEEIFFDSTIYAYDGVVSILWDFGGEGTATEEDVNFTFADEGLYNVTLTVEDGDGSITTVWEEIVVGNDIPVVNFDVTPTTGDEILTVSYNCSVTGGNDPLTYDIDFGDGTILLDTVPTGTHNYTNNGTYTATCDVVDADSDAGSDFQIITVGNNAPVVSLWTNVSAGNEELTVEYNCIVAGGNDPLTYFVDFGDGTTSTSATGTHTYDWVYQPDLSETYTITCEVTDVDSDFGDDSTDITVYNYIPAAYITADETLILEGEDVLLECGSTDGNEPVIYTLDFGDGSTPVTDTTTITEMHTYDYNNTYNATCTAIDFDGDVDVAWLEIEALNNAPVVDLQLNSSMGLEPFHFEYNCTVGGGNEPFVYDIVIENSTTVLFSAADTAPVGSYVLSEPGDYNVTCTATDFDGDSDSETEFIHVWDNVPMVDLVVFPTTGPEGTNFSFECLAIGGNEPLTYYIDFDDGTSTTESSEYHVYDNENIYNVSCVVTDSDLDVGTDWEIVNVTNAAPVVNLEVNTSAGNEQLTVAYNCTAAGGNEPYVFDIDFGDGSPILYDTTPVGTYTYDWVDQPDLMETHTMTCTVTDIDSDSSGDWVDIDVYNYPPVAYITADETVITEGEDVYFECGAADGNEPITYTLDFGDGSAPITDTTTITATHTYTEEELRNATCTTTDTDLDTDTAWIEINVTNNPPIVNLWTNVSAGNEELTVEYDCVVGGGNEPLTYLIDFGDGTTTTDPSGNHTYPWVAQPDIMDTYTITCDVTDVDSDTGSDSEDIEVYNFVPNPVMGASDTTITEGDSTHIECLSTDGNDPLDYVIDLGDGSPLVNAATVDHVYTDESDYNATCTVTDTDGDVATTGLIINVSNNAPVVDVETNVTTGLEPMSVEYNCTVGGGNAPYTYDVVATDQYTMIVGTSTSETGVFDLLLPGEYNITCTVTDIDGDVDSDVATVTVVDNVPAVTLIATPTSGIEGDTIDFQCLATGGNAPLDYVLDFGNGTGTVTSTDADIFASVNYTDEGNYNATCTVTDDDGDVGYAELLVPIGNNVPVVNLVPNVTAGVETLTVDFNCTLVGSGNAPFTYFIDFGDGTTTTSSSASHTYECNDGNASCLYTTSCTITDDDGDVSVPDVEIITVYDSEPDTNFTWSPSSPLEGDLISFTDLSTAHDGIVAWEWMFGDGNTSTSPNPTHTYYQEASYPVTLTTTDGDGSMTSMTYSVTVGNNVPVVDMIVTPNTGTEPLVAAVNCVVVSGGNAPFTYEIQYGDGMTTTSASSMYMYAQDGTYPATCIVTDNDGDVGMDVDTVVVNDTEPTAAFTFAPATPVTGEQVNFTDLSSAYDGIAAWYWDFDEDGVIDSNDQNATFTFTAPGTYEVNLTVEDGDGSTDWTVMTVPVNASLGAPIIFGLTVDVSNTTANISWSTDQGTDALLQYGLTTALGTNVTYPGPATSHFIPITGLTPATTYYYNVTSCNAVMNCTTEGILSFVTLGSSADVTPPGPVTGLGEMSVGTDWIEWGWTNPADADFDHVEVYLNGTLWTTVAGSANTVNVTGLASNTTYEVEIVTVDNSSNANTPGVTDLATTNPGSSVVDTTAPIVTLLAPADGSEEPSGDVTVQWMVTDDTSALLSCEMYSNTSGTWQMDAASMGFDKPNATVQAHNYTGLADGWYEWNVHCTDVALNSAFATANFTFEVNSSASDTTPPAPVTNITSSSSGTDWIAWSWTNPLDADFDHVEIWLNGTFITNTSATGINMTGLTVPGADYTIEIITVDTTGNRNTPGVTDTASTLPIDTTPSISVVATPTSGSAPLTVSFNSTVVGGDGTLTYLWTFGDGIIPDSTSADPTVVYNGDGTFTATVNVTDVDGDWDVTSVVINVGSSVTHNVAVGAIDYNKSSTTTYLDDTVEVTADILNLGGASETVNVELEVNGIVVDTDTVTVAVAGTQTVIMDYVADQEGFDVVIVRAVPVSGESDVTDNTNMTSVRVWSVEDIVSNETREVFLSTSVIAAGLPVTVYMPVDNSYAIDNFADLRVELWSSLLSDFTVTGSVVQYIDLAGDETELVQWTVTPNVGVSGIYDFSAILGNNEINETDITSASLMVV